MNERDDLIGRVRARYTAAEVPPCRVCGKDLCIQSMKAGETIWGCDGLEPDNEGMLRRAPDYDPSNSHYSRSLFDQRPVGDVEVLEALSVLASLQARVERLELHICEQVTHAETRIADGKELGATVWRIALEDIVRENVAALAKQDDRA